MLAVEVVVRGHLTTRVIIMHRFMVLPAVIGVETAPPRPLFRPHLRIRFHELQIIVYLIRLRRQYSPAGRQWRMAVVEVEVGLGQWGQVGQVGQVGLGERAKCGL
jgi:hypothetical protein